MVSSSFCGCSGVASSLLEEHSLDELRNDRSDLNLHVPLLAGVPGEHRHVLQPELELDREPAQSHHLADAETDGHGPDVAGRGLPVRQDVARVPDIPAVAEEDGRDGLKVEL